MAGQKYLDSKKEVAFPKISASLEIARKDPRVRAAVALDGGDPTGLAKPILYLHAAGEVLKSLPPEAVGEIRQQTQAFLQTARPGYDLWITGARHSFSTDHFVLPYLPRTADRTGTIEPTRALFISRVYVRAFFDQNLKSVKGLTIGLSSDFPELVLNDPK